MTTASLWIMVTLRLTLGMVPNTASLICYRCAKVEGKTAAEANLRCLENSREIRCANEEDRCFSLASGPDVNEVEKDCARSTDCVGRICCDSDFCNAGLGITSQRGSGKQCDSIADCVQSGAEMRCTPGQPSELTKTCLCTQDTVNVGAICRKALVKEWCDTSSQCSDTNASCSKRRCVCHSSHYQNDTVCIAKRPLGGECLGDHHCGVRNSVCNGTSCVCPAGQPFSNSSNVCSGGERSFRLRHRAPSSDVMYYLYGIISVVVVTYV